MSITEASETQFLLLSDIPPQVYRHLLKVLTVPHAMGSFTQLALVPRFFLGFGIYFS